MQWKLLNLYFLQSEVVSILHNNFSQIRFFKCQESDMSSQRSLVQNIKNLIAPYEWQLIQHKVLRQQTAKILSEIFRLAETVPQEIAWTHQMISSTWAVSRQAPAPPVTNI